MTLFWFTARSYGLIGNSIREAVETENVNICKSLGHWPWKEKQVIVMMSITLHWAPPRNDSHSPARSQESSSC